MQTIYEFTIKQLGGGELELKRFEGQTVLIVNVASRCGLTPQYTALQKLYESHQDKGFVVLGVPCNQFMGQEPGNDEQIQAFCSSEYSVSFPMTGKVDVNGANRDPLYTFLAGDDAKFSGDISWNFEKFLINKAGQVVARFDPKTMPDSAQVVSAIEQAMSE